MRKTIRAEYTAEFMQEALRLVESGQTLAAVSRTLGVPNQTLHNWVKAKKEGRVVGAGEKPVTPEQMELSRLRAELARTKEDLEILKKAAAYFARQSK